MKDSKLINIIKTFSKEEMKLFEKFIISPFHSRGKNCLPLFKQLLKFYPEYNSEKLTYENLYSKIYPGKKFNRQVMYNLSSETEKMARGFLEQIALRKKKLKRTELLLSEFGSRKLLGSFFDAIKIMERQLQDGEIDYFHIENLAQLESHKLDYFYMVDKVLPMSGSKLKDSEYHILLFLRMITGGLHDMNILSRNYNSKFPVNIPLETAKNLDLKKISDYASANNFKYSFLTEIYYRAISIILKPEIDEHFTRLYGLYRKHYNKFTVNEKRNMMYWLLNYCSFRAETGKTEYERIIFDLNKFRLKEGLVFYPEKQIPKGIYRNIFSSAISAGETKWAENFIKDYTVKLKKEYQVPVSSLAYASLYFSLKKYDKVLEHLNKVVFIDSGDKFIVKALIAKTYFETGEMDSLLHHIDSFHHFLNNNLSVSGTYKNSYRNFLNSLRKLISLSENHDPFLISRFIDDTKSSNELSEKKWLFEKISGLKN